MLLQRVEFRRDQRAHLRVAAARIDERNCQRSTAQGVKRERPAALVDERRIGNAVADARQGRRGRCGRDALHGLRRYLCQRPRFARTVHVGADLVAGVQSGLRGDAKAHRHRRHSPERLMVDQHLPGRRQREHDAGQMLARGRVRRPEQRDERRAGGAEPLHYKTVILAIMPWSSWSRMWQ
jgi:hypothetical protein